MADDLDEMIAEAGGPGAAVAAEAYAAGPSGVPPLPDYVRGLTGSLVSAGGAIICDKARVTRLEQDEVAGLSEALNNLLRFYLTVDGLDEKAAAWLAFGAVSLQVASNRRRLEPAHHPNGRDVDETMAVSPILTEAEIVASQEAALSSFAGGGNDAAAGA